MVRLTSAIVKQAVRELDAAQARITSPCPPCGGDPWRPDETTRICPTCGTISIAHPRSALARRRGEQLHRLMVDILAKSPDFGQQFLGGRDGADLR